MLMQGHVSKGSRDRGHTPGPDTPKTLEVLLHKCEPLSRASRSLSTMILTTSLHSSSIPGKFISQNNAMVASEVSLRILIFGVFETEKGISTSCNI